MKNLNINELLEASFKGAMQNYKQEAPAWFTYGYGNCDASSHVTLFQYLVSNMMQFAIFQGKAVHKHSLYLPESLVFKQNFLDESIKNMLKNIKNIKLLYKNEAHGAIFVSNEDCINFNASQDKIEIVSLNEDNIKLIKEKIALIGKK